MNIMQVSFEAPYLLVSWEDQTQSQFPAVFLRDNDIDELHPQTHERVFDLTTIDLDITPANITHTDNTITLQWPDRASPATYTAPWLYQHRPGEKQSDPADVYYSYWGNNYLERLPRFDAKRCADEPGYLQQMLLTMKREGLILVENMEDKPDAGFHFGDLIGFKRNNNYGVTFDVVSKPDPNNLAYTSIALHLHTDLANQELIPGYQFFHCYRNEAEGGFSTYADGFKVCEDLRNERPEDFELLSQIAVPFRFHDQDYDIRCKHPLIQLDEHGEVQRFIFNAHLAAVPDMPAELMIRFYAAYQELMRRIRSDRYQIQIKLQAGTMAILDNRRVMHGRTAFDPNTGHRQLQGYYIDDGEVDSKIRKLAA